MRAGNLTHPSSQIDYAGLCDLIDEGLAELQKEHIRSRCQPCRVEICTFASARWRSFTTGQFFGDLLEAQPVLSCHYDLYRAAPVGYATGQASSRFLGQHEGGALRVPAC